MKAKYDIYIRKDLQASLDKEPNMSGLINDLLAEHFKNVKKKMDDFAVVGIKSKVAHNFKDEGATIKATSTVQPNLDDVKQFKDRVTEVLDFKPCKHGADPKFCKFAKPGKPCK